MKKHIVITGKVQGIGFRYWLYKAAIQRNIDGWVRNKISGEVEALIIGNDENVNDLIKLCEKGPTFSKVTKVKVQNYQKRILKKNLLISSITVTNIYLLGLTPTRAISQFFGSGSFLHLNNVGMPHQYIVSIII